MDVGRCLDIFMPVLTSVKLADSSSLVRSADAFLRRISMEFFCTGA